MKEFKKELGKIESAHFGLCPDRPCFLGIWLSLSFGRSSGCCVDYFVNVSEECKWDSQDQKQKAFEDLANCVNKLLTDARVNYVDELVGKPIQIQTAGIGTRVKWGDFRILTEVL